MRKFRLAIPFTWLLIGCAWCAAPAMAEAEEAAPGWLVDGWGIEEGLPQNSVISMTQTGAGYLWLGTLNGLARFDGLHFTTFNESNTRGLDSGRIVHLFADGRGVLWVGTESAGVVMIRNGELRPMDIGRGSRAGRLVAATEDAAGAVWLYTADGQLCRYQAGQADVWQVGAQQMSNYRGVAAQPGGGIWVAMDWGLYDIPPGTNAAGRELPVRRFLPAGRLDFFLAASGGGFWRLADGRVQRWSAEKLEQDLGGYPWGPARVSAACEDGHGNLVVGTLGAGIFIFDGAGKVTRLSTDEGLSNNYILALRVDREGGLWVGTDGGGLNRVRRSRFEVPVRGALVQSVCEDAAGGLWLAQGGDVTRLTNGGAQTFKLTNGPVSAFAAAVFVDRRGVVWVGTRNSGLFRLGAEGFTPVWSGVDLNRNISAIYEDRAGCLWVGAQDGLLRWDGAAWRRFTTADGLTADVIRALADDRDGNLWVGTEGGGLNCLRDGRWQVFRKQDGLPSDTVSALLVDAENVLWVGTEGGGLARREGGKWSVCTTRDGLVSDGVGSLLEDGAGFLWLGSYSGLMRISKRALNDFARGGTNGLGGRTYRKADGLPTSECAQGSQPAACRARDGRLWFPTIKGLAGVRPEDLRINSNTPPVVIEAVLVGGRVWETNALRTLPPERIVIPPGGERVEIHFTSLNLSAPERAHFKFRMVGHDDGWTEAGDSRVARYPKLPAGNFVFEVTAANEDGVWNPASARLAVQVLPPFWQRWWFLALAGVAVFGAVAGGVHFVSTQKLQRQVALLRQQEAVERERARIARDLHDQLGANLTQVALLGEFVESDRHLPAEVEAHAQQISQTARATTRALDEIVWAANPANDTLEGLISYACKYAQDFLTVAGLRYRFEVPPNLPATPLAPDIRHHVYLAFKEAVNNVVKHAQAGEAHVRLRLTPAAFTLEIEDDGRGPGDIDSERARTRNGLRNMRRRMEDIHGEFYIGPGRTRGTVVRLTAPVKAN